MRLKTLDCQNTKPRWPKRCSNHDRESLKELALVWDEALPASRNPAYVAKSRELERDLAAALAARLEDRKSG